MHRLNKRAFLNIAQEFMDILCLILSYLITYSILSKMDLIFGFASNLWIFFSYAVIYYTNMYIRGLYKKSNFNYYDRVLKDILFASLMASLFCLIMMGFTADTYNKNYFLGTYIVTSIFLVSLQRYLSIHYYKKILRSKSTKSVIIGTKEHIIDYLSYIKKTSFRLEVMGYIALDGKVDIIGGRNLGDISNLESILSQYVVDEVIFALPRDYFGKAEGYVHICEERGLTVKISLDLYSLTVAKSCIHSVGPLPVLTLHTICLNDYQLLIKRCIDLTGAFVGLMITGILSIIIILAIKLDSVGPILFRQKRVGQNGRIFMLYKFRSMCIDAEKRKKELEKDNQISGGRMFKIKEDPRVTRVGAFLRKTSLDELPQFLNVLKGDMSLVGTRPPTTEEVDKYNNYHRRRISIKPGITGLWQISGRSNITNFEDVVNLDIQYIDNWSVWNDFMIIMKTLLVIFRKNGAY